MDFITFFDSLDYERDVRRAPDSARRGRFRVGWRDGGGGAKYNSKTLSELTWTNLGYRLGKKLGLQADDELDWYFERFAAYYREPHVELSLTNFVRQFQYFCRLIEGHPESPGPFKNFQSGFVNSEEGYKGYVHHEANRRLGNEAWKESGVGSGEILDRVIQAIEIDEGKYYRNNLVAWNLRYGTTARSHRKVLEAREDPRALHASERLFYRFFRQQHPPAETFAEFVDLFGRRYDLVAYFFFLRSCDRYMPIGPEAFEKAFSSLGVPFSLSGQCSWENYQGYLHRLSMVQNRLTEVGVPGVELIDAHSFCWMIGRSKEPEDGPHRQPLYIQLAPNASTFPDRWPSVVGDERAVDFDRLQQARQQIGALAQLVVFDAEKQRLKALGREDLANRVKDVSCRPALGYDIASFTSDGETKPIEVKAAARRGDCLRFFLSENERYWSQLLDNYTFALVLDPESADPKIYEFLGLKLLEDALSPNNYEVRLNLPIS